MERGSSTASTELSDSNWSETEVDLDVRFNDESSIPQKQIYPSSGAVNRFLAAFFVLLNVGGFLFFARSNGYFTSAVEDIQRYSGFLMAGLSFALLPVIGFSFAKRGLASANKGRVTEDICLTVAMLVMAAATVYTCVLGPELLVNQSFLASLPVLLFVIAFYDVVRSELSTRLSGRLGYHLATLAPKARRLKYETESQASDSQLTEERIDSSALEEGDVIRVLSGEMIPCDGTIVSGRAHLTERSYTADGVTRFRSAGQRVFAGSLVRVGTLEINCSGKQEDSTITVLGEFLNSQILNRMEERNHALPGILCVSTLIAAVSCGIFWNETGGSYIQIANAICGVLLVSILTRAVDFLPFIEGITLTKAFHQGVLFKSAESLRRLEGARVAALDYSTSDPIGRARMESLELVDSRLERDQVTSVLLALLGGSTEEFETVATEYLSQQLPEPTLHQVKDYSVYPGNGVSGSINGVEFSVGTEEFLVARGVQIQASEIRPETEKAKYIYLAAEDEIIACCKTSPPLIFDGQELTKRLDRLGVRLVLLSAEEAAKADALGKSMGIELADIVGDLKKEPFQARVATLAPCLVFKNSGSVEMPASAITLQAFDEQRWDFEASDVTTFSRDLGYVARVFELVRRGLRFRQAATVTLYGLAAILLIGAISNFISPGVVAGWCAFSLALYLYLSCSALPENVQS